MKTPSRRGQLAGLLLLATSLASCAAIFGFDELREGGDDGGTHTPADGPVEAPDSSNDAGPDRIEPARACPPPTQVPLQVQTSALTGEVLRFALDGLRLAPEGGENLGLNLDCVDTRTVTESTCTVPPDADTTAVNSLVIDHPDGVDNAISPILFGTAAYFPRELHLDRLSARVQQGILGATLEVVDLGSVEDDSSIVVRVYPARDGVYADAGGCLAVDGGREFKTGAVETLPADDAAPRQLSPSDVWCLDDRFVDNPPVSSAGWVAHGVLVAHFDELVLPYLDEQQPLYSLDLRLQDVWLKAKLTGAGSSMRLEDGVMGGRWSIANLLREVNLNSSSPQEAGNCIRDTLFVPQVAQRICAVGDLGPSADARCNAMSIGIGFSAYAVASRGVPAFVPNYEERCYGRGVAPDAGDAGDPFAVSCPP